MAWYDIFFKAEKKPPEANFKLVWDSAHWALWPNNQDSYIRNSYKGNATLYSIIQQCSDKFSTIPFYLYRVTDEKKAKKYERLTKNGYRHHAELHERLKLKASSLEEIDSGAAFDLLNKPNQSQTESEFWQMAVIMRMVTGASPIYANRGLTGKVRSLYVLPTKYMKLFPDLSLYHIDRAQINISGKDVDIPVEQLYWWRYTDIDMKADGQHLYGLSPLQAALKDIQANTENVKRQANMMENSGATGLFVPKDLQAAQAAMGGPQGVDGLRNTLDDLLSSVKDSSKQRPYLNAPMDYITFGMDAKQMELVQTYRMGKETLANIYNFPVHLLTAENATDNNYNTAVKYLVTNTLYSMLVGKRELVNKWLLPLMGESGLYYDFDITELPELQEDIEKLGNWMMKVWPITPNEVREALRYDKLEIPEMDEPFVPGNLQPISMALAAGMAVENPLNDYAAEG